MGRRAKHEEIEFGSDSFLDIIANIVGILIILIVVAGAQASRAPVVAETPPLLSVEPTKPVPPSEPVPEPVVSEPIPAESEVAAIREVPEVIEPDPELLMQIEDLDEELASLGAKRAALREQSLALEARKQELKRQLDAKGLELNQQAEQAESLKHKLSRLQSALKENRNQLAALQLDIDAAERKKPPAIQIKHKLTPVSRLVKNEEIHFRLAEGKIAPVPIKELIKRLKPQISRQADWIVKFRRHQGQVGPIDGFVMKYVAEREQYSVINEYRGGAVRIVLSQWQIHPEPSLKAETARDALTKNSRFVRALRMADPDSVITFWVYPDSFKLYRQLQEFVRDEGFIVAARPLPFNIPIAGSPNGTRSAGQ